MKRFPIAVLLVIALAAPAAADPIRVRVHALGPGGEYSEDTADHPAFLGQKALHGGAFADARDDSGNAWLAIGPYDPCGMCGISAVLPYGFARAGAEGLAGSLKVRAVATDEEDSFASARAQLSDRIDFLGGPPAINVLLQLSEFHGNADFRFSLSQTIGDAAINYFSFFADQDGYRVTVGGDTIDEGHIVPTSYSYRVETFVLELLGFDADLRAIARDGAVVADNSVYLQIAQPYVSTNGFAYPGAAPAQVPEPGSSVVLLLSGGAIAGLRRRFGKTL